MPESAPPGSTDLKALAERVAGWARDGEQVEAYVSRSRNTEIKVYEGGIESLSQADSEGIGVRVIVDGRQGFAYAGALTEDALAETLAEARDNCSFATPDEFNALATPDGVAAASLDLWRDELATFAADDKVQIAIDMEKRVRDGDRRIRGIESAEYYDSLGEAAVATSTGISVYDRGTYCVTYAAAIAGEGDDTQTGFGITIGRGPSDLDLDEAAKDAIEKSTRLLGAKKPKSAKLTIVLDPDTTSTLLSIIGGTLDGESVLKGRSLFADRVGDEVAATSITLVEDPTNAAALGATAYDDEGLATRPVPLISGGVLQGFLYNTYAARRAGTASTASAARGGFKTGPGISPRALSLSPGAQSPEEILAGIELGLYVQEMNGIHSGVNPISGDFSVGAEGLMIRNGELAEPVREITVASTLQRMLRDICAVGNDVKWRYGAAAGQTIAIADVSMSGS